jgi:nuclear pore complex protein Nup54
MSVSRMLVSSGGVGGPVYVPSSAKVDEQSLCDLQEVKELYFSLPSVIAY